MKQITVCRNKLTPDQQLEEWLLILSQISKKANQLQGEQKSETRFSRTSIRAVLQ